MKLLDTIRGVKCWQEDDGWCHFLSNLDIDNDGSGPSHGDPSYQNDTSLHDASGKALNADNIPYIVLPPQLACLVGPQVLGCSAILKRRSNDTNIQCVVGDWGPHCKTGEASYYAAHYVNSNITHNSGDDHYDYEYWWLPGSPAQIVSAQNVNIKYDLTSLGNCEKHLKYVGHCS